MSATTSMPGLPMSSIRPTKGRCRWRRPRCEQRLVGRAQRDVGADALCAGRCSDARQSTVLTITCGPSWPGCGLFHHPFVVGGGHFEGDRSFTSSRISARRRRTDARSCDQARVAVTPSRMPQSRQRISLMSAVSRKIRRQLRGSWNHQPLPQPKAGGRRSAPSPRATATDHARRRRQFVSRRPRQDQAGLR